MMARGTGEDKRREEEEAAAERHTQTQGPRAWPPPQVSFFVGRPGRLRGRAYDGVPCPARCCLRPGLLAPVCPSGGGGSGGGNQRVVFVQREGGREGGQRSCVSECAREAAAALAAAVARLPLLRWVCSAASRSAGRSVYGSARPRRAWGAWVSRGRRTGRCVWVWAVRLWRVAGARRVRERAPLTWCGVCGGTTSAGSRCRGAAAACCRRAGADSREPYPNLPVVARVLRRSCGAWDGPTARACSCTKYTINYYKYVRSAYLYLRRQSGTAKFVYTA